MGKNCPQNRKVEKFHVLKCWMLSFESWMLLLHRGLRINKLQFLQCCGSGSGIQCLFNPWNWIPNPYFWEFSETFLGKKFYNSLKIGPNYFLQHFKNWIIFNFVKFVAAKKGMTTNFFHPSLLLLFLDPGPGSEIRDPGCIKIRIRDKHPGSATLNFWIKKIKNFFQLYQFMIIKTP